MALPCRTSLPRSYRFTCRTCSPGCVPVQLQSDPVIQRSSYRVRCRGITTNSQTASTLAHSHTHQPASLEVDTPRFVRLTDRSLIRLHGADVVHFLNGLLPCRLQALPEPRTKPIFTAFLSAKGRILYDAFIYPPARDEAEAPWYIEVDSRSASAVYSHLKKHKLRSRFKLEKVASEELDIIYTWPADATDLAPDLVGGQDPRPQMGMRFLTPRNRSADLVRAYDERSLEDYKVHRMIAGHAEGPSELISNSALPQESNLDFYSNGIDFHKGCYLGQELTIRTHHTGVVRKRILPCQLYDPQDSSQRKLSSSTESEQEQSTLPEYDASISSSIHQPLSETNLSKLRSAGGRAGRSTGKWLNGVGNIGLALCRLEMMTDIQLTAEGGNYNPQDQYTVIWEEKDASSSSGAGQSGDGEEDGGDGDSKATIREVRVRPFVPTWLRQNIEAGIRARSERSRKKRRQEEDEEEESDVD